ncbi:MAG: BrnT family toxin [Anaerolineales bacterium]|nr:BrnT family toxin [Anaerolineales bacterium]
MLCYWTNQCWTSIFFAFTERNDNIRVISAREMSRKERKAYGEAYT